MRQLMEGYGRFRSGYFAQNRALFAELGHGQSPPAMIIACCDSRVDPAYIFDAQPGDVFVVRNVANLVPPREEHGLYHGTSAAIEFAVTALRVRTILVLGHSGCGGVAAALDGAGVDPDSFIGKWISLLDPAKASIRGAADRDPQRALERASIATSCANLRTFPFVCQALAEGRLELAGGHFDIATGSLQLLNEETGTFTGVPDRVLPGDQGDPLRVARP